MRLADAANEDEAIERERRVMAVCYGSGTGPAATTTAVMLDPAGHLVDFLHLPQFRCGVRLGVVRWSLLCAPPPLPLPLP